jgi:hypothetical protein
MVAAEELLIAYVDARVALATTASDSGAHELSALALAAEREVIRRMKAPTPAR